MRIEEARNIYKKNNCSLFVMAREDVDNYTAYKELNIDKKIERQWTVEVIEDLVNSLKETGDSKIFNQLYDLSVSLHDRERLMLMIKSMNAVKIKNAETSLCIAETIIGRKILSVRSGMVFWAYDLGEKEEAVILIEKALSFINIKANDIKVKERVNRDLKKVKEIVEMLKLKIDTKYE